MSLKAVIFDKDGVLIDTEPGIVAATQKTIEKFGGDPNWFSLESRLWTGGISARKTFENLIRDNSWSVSLEEVLSDYQNYHIEWLKKNPCKALEGAKELLAELKKNRIKAGIGTGSIRTKSELTLDQSGIRDFINVMVTSEDVSEPKPAPDTFLEAARRLNVSLSECVVVGDSHNDRLGAKAAGMKFVFRTHTYEKQIDNMHPDLVVPSLRDLKVDALKALFD